MAGQSWYSLSLQLPLKWPKFSAHAAKSQELVQDAADKFRAAVPARRALMKLEYVLIEHRLLMQVRT